MNSIEQLKELPSFQEAGVKKPHANFGRDSRFYNSDNNDYLVESTRILGSGCNYLNYKNEFFDTAEIDVMQSSGVDTINFTLGDLNSGRNKALYFTEEDKGAFRIDSPQWIDFKGHFINSLDYKKAIFDNWKTDFIFLDLEYLRYIQEPNDPKWVATRTYSELEKACQNNTDLIEAQSWIFRNLQIFFPDAHIYWWGHCSISKYRSDEYPSHYTSTLVPADGWCDRIYQIGDSLQDTAMRLDVTKDYASLHGIDTGMLWHTLGYTYNNLLGRWGYYDYDPYLNYRWGKEINSVQDHRNECPFNFDVVDVIGFWKAVGSLVNPKQADYFLAYCKGALGMEWN